MVAPGGWQGVTRGPSPQFLCEEGAGDYIARVDEPQSCSYVLTVHTTRICHHPFLRPSPGLAPQPIRCQPALSPAQYVQYVRAQVCEYWGPLAWAWGHGVGLALSPPSQGWH